MIGPLAGLKTLVLSNNHFSDKGMRALGRQLSCLSALTDLGLAGSGPAFVDLSLRTFREITCGLSHLMSLKRLDLSGRGIAGDELALSMWSFSEALRKLAALTHLDMSCAKMGGEGAETICACVLSLAALENLNVSFNRIRDAGASSVAQSAMWRRSLHVDVAHNANSNQWVNSRECPYVCMSLKGLRQQMG